MSARRAPVPAQPEPSLSAGYLAALPLFCAYELGLLGLSGSAARSPAEVVVGGALGPLGEALQAARVVLLLAAAGLAWVRLTRQGVSVPLATLPRQVAEGLAAGFLLAPALLALDQLLGAPPWSAADEAPRSLLWTLRLVGTAPWEELLFRVALYGILFLGVRHLASFLGWKQHLARFAAEFVGLLGSAVFFAAFHLGPLQGLLGSQGEPFHAGLFTWRVSAGILLGGLFRWRGFGVAAWAHALFNLGLALGIRP